MDTFPEGNPDVLRLVLPALDALSAHVAILDHAGTIVAVNRAWRRFGEQQGLRMPNACVGVSYFACCDDVAGEYGHYAAAASRGIRDVAAGQRPDFYLEYPCPTPTTTYWFQLRVTRFPGDAGPHILTSHENVTEVKTAEHQLHRQAAELAQMSRGLTAGQTAAELAHELNQPLGSIVNYARGCIRRMETAKLSLPDIMDALKQISLQAERAGEIVKSVRRRTERHLMRPSQVQLNSIMSRAVRLAEAEAREGRVSIIFESDDSIPPIRGDAVQIQQVVMNLIRNAIEAMHDAKSKERRITVITRREGKLARVTVRDTGPGIPPGMLATVFQPFFTTKSHGMGLGLAMSRSIVQAHGGTIEAANDPGGGAAVSFTLAETLG
jgi:signal transduction histidine kinase